LVTVAVGMASGYDHLFKILLVGDCGEVRGLLITIIMLVC
jgi:hypothetical protein